jgi:hypothetical protein
MRVSQSNNSAVPHQGGDATSTPDGNSRVEPGFTFTLVAQSAQMVLFQM